MAQLSGKLTNYFTDYKLYGIYCNQLSKDRQFHADGRSSFFGMTDQTTLNWLVKNKYAEEFPVEKGKLLEIQQNIEHDYLLVDVDINHKEPSQKPPPGQFNLSKECCSGRLNEPTGGIEPSGEPNPIIPLDEKIVLPKNLSNAFEVSNHAYKYLSNLINIYNYVPVVNQGGKVNSKTLRQEHIFVSPRLYQTDDFKILKTTYSQENESNKSQNTQTIGEFINRGLNKIVLLGNPGQGKTTLANWIVTSFSCRLLKDKCTHQIPDTSTLKEINLFPLILNCKKVLQFNSTKNLQYLISQCLLQFGEIFDDDISLQTEIIDMVKSGRAIFIIDGIEEIKSENVRRNICNCISTISESYSSNYFVFTSRIFGYSNIQNLVGDDFIHLKIDEFNSEQKEEFIRQFSKFQDLDERDKKKLLSEINNPLVEPITRTPLNLTNICIVFSNSGCSGNRRFPEDFKDLYLGSIQLLFERINSIQESIRFTEEILFELAWISYQLTESLNNELTEISFIELISGARNKFKVNSGISAKKLFHFLVSKVGLFDNVLSTNKSGIEKTVVRFFHESYREFLAGYFIVLLGSKNFSKSNNQLDIIDKLCSQFVVMNKTTKVKSKPLNIKGDNFTIVNYAFSVFDISTKNKIIELLISNPNGKYKQAQFSARVVLACHCLSNNFKESYELEESAKKAFAALCNLTVAYDLKTENHHSDINKAFRRLEKTRWQESFMKIISESKVALEYYINCENDDTDEIENLKLRWAQNTELYSKSILKSKEHWDNFVKCNSDVDLLKFSFDCINIGFEYVNSKNRSDFEIFQEVLPNIILKLFNLLEHKNNRVRSIAAYAISWLAASKYDDNGVWEPTKTELDKIRNILEVEKDVMCFRYLFRVIKSESDKWLFKGNLFYQIANQIENEEFKFDFRFEVLSDSLTNNLFEFFASCNSNACRTELALNLCRYGIKDKLISTTILSEWVSLSDSQKYGYALPYFLFCDDEATNEKIFQTIFLSGQQSDSNLVTLVLVAMKNFNLQKSLSWLNTKWLKKNSLKPFQQNRIELLSKINKNGTSRI